MAFVLECISMEQRRPKILKAQGQINAGAPKSSKNKKIKKNCHRDLQNFKKFDQLKSF